MCSLCDRITVLPVCGKQVLNVNTQRLGVKDAKILTKMDVAGAGTGREGLNPGGEEGQKRAVSPVPLTATSSRQS